MEEDSGSPKENKADALLALVNGPLATSAARLSANSRAVPAGRDFHFYRNFEEFGSPAREVASRSESLLTSIVSSELVDGKLRDGADQADLPGDLDDAHDWVVLLNDELVERFNASMDEFGRSRMEEESGTVAEKAAAMEAGGFQIVKSKKSKKNKKNGDNDGDGDGGGVLGVKVASRDRKTAWPRSQVPFHIPSIPRPQDSFKILVNNSNQPFEHVWLETGEDGNFVHPLEKLSVLDFMERNVGKAEPTRPPPIEDTPFKFVEEVKDLKELAAKLRAVDEFSVDLEHNQYRSFQGLTCLMQISTRTEDFIVDTLKLRIHVGPYLREVFKDPSKRKVMHGSDRDILWLQRDFGIYVCNLFDTGQASRVLQLERNSLEFLLQYFCAVTANKEYQQADWRLRPLPEEMIKYAREDTHYLLFMYDVMRQRLLSESSVPDIADSLLAEVYRRSSDICLQLYEKELLTDTSFLRIYGLSESDFSPQQIAVVAGLWEWRDYIARAEDESTGYILPNKALLEIARQMPLTAGMLKRLVKSKHPYVERNLSSVVDVIKNAVVNAASFEPVAENLKNAHSEAKNEAAGESTAAATAMTEALTLTDPVEIRQSATVKEVSVQRREKPAGAFGALFGGSSAKRKLASQGSTKVNAGQGEAAAKVEMIRSSVALPFHPFSGSAAGAPPSEPCQPAAAAVADLAEPPVDFDYSAGQLGDVIMLAEPPVDDGPQADEPPQPPAATFQNGSAAVRWEPFDYEAAKKEVKFGNRREARERAAAAAARGGGGGDGGATASEFSAPRRCQAYPASGNRSATFR